MMKLLYVFALGALLWQGGASANEFSGVWINPESDSRGIVKVIIDQGDSGAGSIIALSACVPVECNWGVTALQEEGGTLTASYEQEHKVVELVLQPTSADRLEVRETSTYYNTADRQVVTVYVMERDANNKGYRIPQ